MYFYLVSLELIKRYFQLLFHQKSKITMCTVFVVHSCVHRNLKSVENEGAQTKNCTKNCQLARISDVYTHQVLQLEGKN